MGKSVGERVGPIEDPNEGWKLGANVLTTGAPVLLSFESVPGVPLIGDDRLELVATAVTRMINVTNDTSIIQKNLRRLREYSASSSSGNFENLLSSRSSPDEPW